ncbi:PEP-CTERM sorting domain-containing protein, partial [Enterococcus faecium]|uniref:PEP-CTERM sorting domain-containing protein n=1 Tax=Enterococcus faecium TaxID=1352 RepID=UPI0010C2400D
YGYGGYGYYGFTGYTYAQFGDPNGFNSVQVAFNEQNIRISSVSEPTPLLFAGLGLAGLAFRRRRQS